MKKSFLAAAFAICLMSSCTAQAQVPPQADSEAFISAAESTINGVVSVKSYATPRATNYYSPFSDPFFEYFFGSPQPQQRQPQQGGKERQTGLGSGVIISEDGYIVTNNHVIADAERLEVTLNDNRTFDAAVIGADPVTDIAVIKIEAPDLHVIPLGNSEDLRVGEWVLAVGNPFGFTSTVTSGIVSAKARSISSASQSAHSAPSIESYIQTDAALNAGNSGGALVNLRGELVGINTAIYSQTGSYAGCSFAIPVSIVQKIAGDLMEYGTVQRAMLGISYAEVDADLVREKDIKGVNAGIYVHEVSDKSAASEAGLQQGDVIVAINKQPTLNSAQVQEALAKCSPGQEVEITYWRDGKQTTKRATLRNGQGSTSITRAGNVSELGCEFKDADSDLLKELGLKHGVQVDNVSDGPFKKAGIRSGYVIVSINGSRMRSAQDIEKLYNSIVGSADSDKVMFIKGVYPGGKAEYYAVALE